MSNFEFGVCPCACARRLSATTLPCESQPMTSAYVANSVGTVYSFILERQRTKCVGLRFSSVPLPIHVADWGKIWRANTDAWMPNFAWNGLSYCPRWTKIPSKYRNFDTVLKLCGFCVHPLCQSRPGLARYSSLFFYSLNFTVIYIILWYTTTVGGVA